MSYHSKKSFAQRFSGLFFVIALHLIVLIGLIIGLKPKGEMEIVADVKVEAKEDIQETAEAPPPPPPDFVPPPPPTASLPEFNVAEAPAAPVNAIRTEVPKAAPPPPATKTAAGLPPGMKGITKPNYPSESLKLGEEGTVLISVLVGTNGKVEDAKIEGSSGFERLDQAVLKESKRWKNFIPCKDGETLGTCWVTFKMKMQVKEQ